MCHGATLSQSSPLADKESKSSQPWSECVTTQCGTSISGLFACSQSRQLVPCWLLLIICEAAENGMTGISCIFCFSPKATDKTLTQSVTKKKKKRRKQNRVSPEVCYSHTETTRDVNPPPATARRWRLAERPADRLAVLIISHYTNLHRTSQLSARIIPEVIPLLCWHRYHTGTQRAFSSTRN